MKQYRTKSRWLSSSEDRATAEYKDWIHDLEQREYKKSDEHKQAQQLADQFKKRVK